MVERTPAGEELSNRNRDEVSMGRWRIGRFERTPGRCYNLSCSARFEISGLSRAGQSHHVGSVFRKK